MSECRLSFVLAFIVVCLFLSKLESRYIRQVGVWDSREDAAVFSQDEEIENRPLVLPPGSNVTWRHPSESEETYNSDTEMPELPKLPFFYDEKIRTAFDIFSHSVRRYGSFGFMIFQ